MWHRTPRISYCSGESLLPVKLYQTTIVNWEIFAVKFFLTVALAVKIKHATISSAKKICENFRSTVPASVLLSYRPYVQATFWHDIHAHTHTCSPAYATPKLLDKTGLKLSDIDVFEYHEAFAVSPTLLYCTTQEFCGADYSPNTPPLLPSSSLGPDPGQLEGYGLGLVCSELHWKIKQGKAVPAS